MSTRDEIEKILIAEFAPEELVVQDDSAQHAGHAGALESGGGHFGVRIVSSKFEGVAPLDRHRMIYKALKPLSSRIHALAISASSPNPPY